MSAVDEIEAAIAKLTELRDAGTNAPWGSENITELAEPQSDLVAETRGGTVLVAAQALNTDADLIVTLHRTIDAQLGFLILVRDLDMGASLDMLGHSGFFGKVLDLARAINDPA